MAVEAHTRQFMSFQANMLEASQKFGSLEEEHLAQMITFVMKMSEVGLVWLHLSPYLPLSYCECASPLTCAAAHPPLPFSLWLCVREPFSIWSALPPPSYPSSGSGECTHTDRQGTPETPRTNGVQLRREDALWLCGDQRNRQR